MKNMCGIETYRAPLGRMIRLADYPARWAGLRDGAPLALVFWPNGPISVSPAHRAGFASTTNMMRPERPRYDGRWHSSPPGEILKALGQREAEIQQGMKEREGMLK